MEKLTTNVERYVKRAVRNSPIRWKELGFAFIPHRLLFDENIPRAALMVYWVLLAHQFQGKAYCSPSNALICKESRYSRPTVTTAIKALEEAGWLDCDRTAGKVTHYYVKAR